MAFLIGIYGLLTHSADLKDLLYTESLKNADGELRSFIDDQIMLYCGYTKDEIISDKIVPLSDNRGILLGKIFDKEQYKEIQDIHKLTQDLHDPKTIFNNFWGRYIGVFKNQNSKTVTFVRDPLGLSTIFYTIIDNSIIFSTDIALLHNVIQKKPSINWEYFASFIVHQNPVVSSTPFQDIHELLPGAALTVGINGIVGLEYPWDIESLSGSYIHDTTTFEEELLETLKKCTLAWSEGSNGVCLEFSGGLDSSSIAILLDAILQPEKKKIGVNYFDSKIATSNEIEHAQKTADLCNMPLLFLDWQNTSLLDPVPKSWRPNTPGNFLLFYGMSMQMSKIASLHECDIIMNGQGGDHIFIAPAAREALADAWLDKRFRDLPAIANELCGIYRIPWFQLIKRNVSALKSYYFPKTAKLPETPYLTDAFSKNLKPYDFYLNKRIAKFHPAKATQFKSILQHAWIIERDRRLHFRSYVHPLMSQPLIELALKIPTYQSFKNGYDRIFFRKAVNRFKPVNSLWRTVKGQTTGSIMKSFANNSQKLEGILLNGSLIKNGVVNKAWLQEQISTIKHSRPNNSAKLSNILMCQLWLNQWENN